MAKLTNNAANAISTGSNALTINKTLTGTPGDDSLLGGDGNDSIIGGAGNDTIDGGAGNDTLDGGVGSDLIVGGDGIDTVTYAGQGAIIMNLSTGVATVGGDTDTLVGIENVIGSDYADYIIGNDAANTINGGLGDDSMSGGAGRDSLLGGDGNDAFVGGRTATRLMVVRGMTRPFMCWSTAAIPY
jgi:Ca2+-binding RTX toxin-like protein